jgi:hypothetical protein
VIGLTDPNRTVLRRRIAVAALMWGYGVSGLRWGNELVAAHSTMLGQQLDQVLAGCEADLLNNNVEAAYRRFVTVGRGRQQDPLYERVGSPFFSKILYFLGKNLAMGKYPLILDTKVSIALAQLTGFRLLVRPSGHRPLPDSEAYGLYVDYVHAWAANLGVQPEGSSSICGNTPLIQPSVRSVDKLISPSSHRRLGKAQRNPSLLFPNFCLASR